MNKLKIESKKEEIPGNIDMIQFLEKSDFSDYLAWDTFNYIVNCYHLNCKSFLCFPMTATVHLPVTPFSDLLNYPVIPFF